MRISIPQTAIRQTAALPDIVATLVGLVLMSTAIWLLSSAAVEMSTELIRGATALDFVRLFNSR